MPLSQAQTKVRKKSDVIEANVLMAHILDGKVIESS